MTQTTQAPETDTDPTDTPDEKPKLQLSATQLTASSLAAVTSAVIGAQLGVAGTLIGAAVGSLVAGIASALYQTSLQRTQRRLSAIAKTAKAPASGAPKRTLAPGTTTSRAESGTAADGAAPEDHDDPAVESEASGRRRPWKVLVATAVAAFVLGVLGLTAIELATGKAVSGGSGTTISQVRERSGSVTDDQTDTPIENPSQGDEAPSEQPSQDPSSGTPTDQPTEDPSTTPTEDPTATPEQPTDEPTAPPTEEPTENPGGTGTGTGEQGDSDSAAASGADTSGTTEADGDGVS